MNQPWLTTSDWPVRAFDSNAAKNALSGSPPQELSRINLHLCSVKSPSNNHSTGTSAGAPLFLIKNTRNFAGLVSLAFCGSQGLPEEPGGPAWHQQAPRQGRACRALRES